MFASISLHSFLCYVIHLTVSSEGNDTVIQIGPYILTGQSFRFLQTTLSDEVRSHLFITTTSMQIRWCSYYSSNMSVLYFFIFPQIAHLYLFHKNYLEMVTWNYNMYMSCVMVVISVPIDSYKCDDHAKTNKHKYKSHTHKCHTMKHQLKNCEMIMNACVTQ